MSNVIKHNKMNENHNVQKYDIEAFEQLGQKMVREAREKAKSIMDNIEDEVASYKEKVHEEAREQGYKEGFTQGKQEGFEKAKQESYEDIKRKGEELVRLIDKVVDEVKTKRDVLIREAEIDLLKLAVEIAKKIIKVEVGLNTQELAKENILKAIELVTNRKKIVVCLNPQDYSSVEKFIPELKFRYPDLLDIELQRDNSITSGGVKIVSSNGEIDAQIETQITEIERQLFINYRNKKW